MGTKKEVVLTIITILRSDRAILQYGIASSRFPIDVSPFPSPSPRPTPYPFPYGRPYERDRIRDRIRNQDHDYQGRGQKRRDKGRREVQM
jgi:hypothetical protein